MISKKTHPNKYTIGLIKTISIFAEMSLSFIPYLHPYELPEHVQFYETE